MTTYFSTFITGTGKIIERAIKKKQSERFRIKSFLDGLVVYESDYQLRDIRSIRFFNNTFILLKKFERLGDKPLQQMVRDVVKNEKLINQISGNLRPNQKTFKIVTSLENKTIPIDRSLLNQLEKKLSAASGLRLNIKHPDTEIWFLARREGAGFFGMRITHLLSVEKRDKGQLRYELAHILCLESEPNPKDVFLDPFAGSGAIPLERTGSFPFKKVIAIDKNQKLFNSLQDKLKKLKKRVDVQLGDALELKSIKDSSISKIVSDPPWGIYAGTNLPLRDFYYKMLNSFYRVLKPNGIAVLLIANKELFEGLLSELSNKFVFSGRHDILVSGKKAAIYKLKKRQVSL